MYSSNTRVGLIALLLGVLMPCVSGVQADVVMEWVRVGDSGNAADTRYETPGYGSVDYTYNIGRYEVTNAQYCEFLNAVATVDDPHGLYNPDMSDGWFVMGGITRTGSPGSYQYWVRPNRGDRPVNYVSWYDALRFANWMDNGQGGGDTEDGAYDMSLGASVARKPGALVWLPSEDEWYKAAYYKGGEVNAGYWDYPTQSDSAPTAEGPPGTDMTNGSANYGSVVGDLTDVGAYTAKPSASAYGTYDQGGNVEEWNEAEVLEGSYRYRGFCGGSLTATWESLRAGGSSGLAPTSEYDRIGFRVAVVPEPATLGLLALGVLVAIRPRR